MAFYKVHATIAFLFILKSGLILSGCSNAKFKSAIFAICVCSVKLIYAWDNS